VVLICINKESTFYIEGSLLNQIPNRCKYCNNYKKKRVGFSIENCQIAAPL
jgi:hypothetical protein